MTEAMKKIQEQIDSRYEAIDELHMDFAICPVEHEPKIESRIKELTAELTVLEAQKKTIMNGEIKTTVKYTVENIGQEEIAKVSYIWGHFEANNLLDPKYDDLLEIIECCTKIAIDWANEVDIEDFEEEGYVSKYAERKITELYGKK